MKLPPDIDAIIVAQLGHALADAWRRRYQKSNDVESPTAEQAAAEEKRASETPPADGAQP